MWMWLWVWTCMVFVWRFKDKSVESVLSCLLYVSSRDQKLVTKLAQQMLLPVEPSGWPLDYFYRYGKSHMCIWHEKLYRGWRGLKGGMKGNMGAYRAICSNTLCGSVTISLRNSVLCTRIYSNENNNRQQRSENNSFMKEENHKTEHQDYIRNVDGSVETEK